MPLKNRANAPNSRAPLRAWAPILADAMYGKTPRDPRVAAVAKTLGRQALHARVLGFASNEHREVRFEAPWPADLASAYEQLCALEYLRIAPRAMISTILVHATPKAGSPAPRTHGRTGTCATRAPISESRKIKSFG